jgi:aminoglycoside phosphotransferase (APT) family kinase protein
MTADAAAPSDRNALPLESLGAYLSRQMPELGTLQSAVKFKGGQSNPTYLLQTASQQLVLRRKPSGRILASAHAVEREFRVLSALHGHGVPVARPLHLCEDPEIIGSTFYLMAYVDGEVHWDPALPKVAGDRRMDYYDAAIAAMAAIHQVNVAARGLGDYGRPGNYFARQIKRWSEQYRASQTDTLEAMERLIDWLPRHCPDDDGRVALVHGDFRFDNMMFARGEPRVLAIVDWELSTLGHPHADLGYFCMALRLPRNPVLSGLAGMDRAALGIPDEARLISRYAELTGAAPADDWSFHLAFNFFRLASIAQGVYQRARQGNASSEQADSAGQMARLVAEMGADCTR